MILHAFSIILKEFNSHLTQYYDAPVEQAKLGNLAEGVSGSAGNGDNLRNALIFSIVNTKEEKTLKNTYQYQYDTTNQKAIYSPPPVFLNFQVLIAATHTDYKDALVMLSRAIRFFQYHNVFTPESVSPASIIPPTATNNLDELVSFKLIMDLYSPNMEEVNHLWGTLGGKQYPFVLYTLRMLELQFKANQGETGLIQNIINNIHHKAS
ncbi:Protein of unknown function [Thiothrix caldifontis]|uniref:Pvc16 N-terminal domain-containing protein n=1 Tax=Thiothrix caldifontis TaxID=525918 RepID=A0A1H4BIC1_9GAMM|nr:DUF4255 domain-containing protein [Thiothrix caldifontis]SEA47891.1 Protein of unknown function [Thiothrix caldifontis]